eukprot:m.65526 g.65526  ORF g.65526 m.65526 type:complete len:74 (-) comp7328_c0_seq1:141-362(-)
MCQQTVCRNCSKITWAPCHTADHFQKALENIPSEDRCACPPLPKEMQTHVEERHRNKSCEQMAQEAASETRNK